MGHGRAGTDRRVQPRIDLARREGGITTRSSGGIPGWLFGYDRAILHSKVAVPDGYYVANGSYNLTLRSGRADLELQFFLQDPDYGGDVRRRIRKDLELSRAIRPGAVARMRSRFSLPIFDAIVRYFLL